MTGNQMKYLLALLSQPEERQNQASIAKIYGVNKSTVSRTMVEAVKQGLLTEAGKRYQLTGYGREYITAYQKNLEGVVLWLTSRGIPPEKAREDGFVVLESCSEETITMLQQRGRLSRLYQRLDEKGLDGEVAAREVQAGLVPGEYPVSFVFYRREEGDGRIPFQAMDGSGNHFAKRSMANQAFEHPAVIMVTKTEAYVCLRTRNMMQKSGQNREMLLGRLKTMKYQIRHKEYTVMLNDETVYIPMEVMRYVYVSEEHLLRGHMECTMTCTVGNIHMPESTAELVLYFID